MTSASSRHLLQYSSAAILTTLVVGTTPSVSAADLQYVNPRRGIPNVMALLNAGKPK